MKDDIEELALHRVLTITLDADEDLTLDHSGISYYEAAGMLLVALFHHVGFYSAVDEDEDDDDE